MRAIFAPWQLSLQEWTLVIVLEGKRECSWCCNVFNIDICVFPNLEEKIRFGKSRTKQKKKKAIVFQMGFIFSTWFQILIWKIHNDKNIKCLTSDIDVEIYRTKVIHIKKWGSSLCVFVLAFQTIPCSALGSPQAVLRGSDHASGAFGWEALSQLFELSL